MLRIAAYSCLALLVLVVGIATVVLQSQDHHAFLKTLMTGEGMFSPVKTMLEGSDFVRVSFWLDNALPLF